MFSQGATLAKLPPKITLWAPKNKILGSRLAPFWTPRGVLGSTLAPKRVHKGSDTTEQEKLEKTGSGNLGSAARGPRRGALGKQQILRKASLNTGENAHPAKWRKPGPLGKGNY